MPFFLAKFESIKGETSGFRQAATTLRTLSTSVLTIILLFFKIGSSGKPFPK